MKIVSILLLMVVIISCDTRTNTLKLRNVAPVLTLTKNLNSQSISSNVTYTATITDSAKIYLPYKIGYQLNEEQIQTPINVKYVNGILTYRDSIVNETKGLIKGTGLMSYEPAANGIHHLEFTVTDGWGSSGIANMYLTVFENLLPHAGLQVQAMGVNSPYERKLNGSTSYDRDEKFGGKIIAYQFIVGNDSTIFPTPIMNYIFTGPGQYSVGLRVKDNNNAWSTVTSVLYTII